MKVAVVVFPGSNCERDCEHVLENVIGASVVRAWHRDHELPKVDCVVLPGGFSYGDYLRAGAVSKISPIMKAVSEFAFSGGPVIGICNGFQVLLECGLLPGAMLRNRSLRFVCKDTFVRCATERTPFTSGLSLGEVLKLPIAHAEGNYYVDAEELRALQDNDQIVFQYTSGDGEANDGANPNGSIFNIAGVCNRAGNVLGMMPHPERAAEDVLGNSGGAALFASIIHTL
ncbi:MAG: phosphoribosylformylglycinamidine synthase I [Bradymonadaceae bacterium]|nr:phosphoribosylformylglycinamidine synthase I [Lujinxingiaceae bacterium]